MGDAMQVSWRRERTGVWRAVIDGVPSCWTAERNDNDAGTPTAWALHEGDDLTPRAEGRSRRYLAERLVAIWESRAARNARMGV